MWETSLLLQDPALGMGPHVMVACPCSTVTLCATASFADFTSDRDDSHWKNTHCARLSCTFSCRIRTMACWFLIRDCSGSPPPLAVQRWHGLKQVSRPMFWTSEPPRTRSGEFPHFIFLTSYNLEQIFRFLWLDRLQSYIWSLPCCWSFPLEKLGIAQE